MLKYTLYLLPIFLFYQVLIGNPGSKWIDTSLSDLEQSAKDGDPYAQGFLALCHLHGDKGLTISHVEAQYFAQQSASKGYWLGDFVLGYLYSLPPLGPDKKRMVQHYLKAFRDTDGTLIKLGAKNDPVALYALGEIFTAEELSPYATTDIEMAAQYFALSAQALYPPACLQSGLIHIYGLTDLISEDSGLLEEEGIKLLQFAIGKKMPAAHHYLARCFLEGTGVKSDMKMALIHFQAAADRGFGLSQLVLSDFHEHGTMGPVDLKKALQYAKMANLRGIFGAKEKVTRLENPSVERDQIGAINDSSASYSEVQPSNSNEREIIEIKTLNTLNTESPSSSSKLILPSAYETTDYEINHSSMSSSNPRPKIDAKDLSHEKEKNSKLFPLRNAQSLLQEGKRLYWSKDEPNSLEQASKVFELSAELGDAEAARYLGLMYLRGKGVPKDTNLAIKWFEEAANRGDKIALKNLDSLKRIPR